MSDQETRREDARIEAAIDRALKNGTASHCDYCGDITTHGVCIDDDEYLTVWRCKGCQRMMDEPGD